MFQSFNLKLGRGGALGASSLVPPTDETSRGRILGDSFSSKVSIISLKKIYFFRRIFLSLRERPRETSFSMCDFQEILAWIILKLYNLPLSQRPLHYTEVNHPCQFLMTATVEISDNRTKIPVYIFSRTDNEPGIETSVYRLAVKL